MKKCKECGREEWGYLSVLNEDGYCPRCAIVHYEEKIKKLQEQLNDANDIIDFYFPKVKKIHSVCIEPLKLYRKKWGVK